jgi:erythromycin esterase-like protein
MKINFAYLIILFFLLLLPIYGENQIVDWIESQIVPLDGIKPEIGLKDMNVFADIVGDANIVALGECSHGIQDIVIFRIRLLEYLVKVKGFRVISLESGFYESQLANRYIHGKEDDLAKVLAQAFTFNMGEWEETKQLLHWMRKYNLAQNDFKQKIYFIGMDLPHFQDAIISRTDEIDSPLEQVLDFLQKVDSDYYNSSGKQLKKIALKAFRIIDDTADFFAKFYGKRYIDPDYLDELCLISYYNLTTAEKMELAFLLHELINVIEIRRLRYAKFPGVSSQEVEINLQLARICSRLIGNIVFRARQPVFPNIDKISDFLTGKILNRTDIRQLKLNKISFNNTRQEWRNYFENRNGRERIMFENVRWIVEQYGKVMIFAHNSHISKVGYITQNELFDQSYEISMGNLLADYYGKNYVVIAQTMDRYIDEHGNEITEHHGMPIESTDNPEAIEYFLRQVPYDIYALPINQQIIKQNPKIYNWLNQNLKGRFQYRFELINHFQAYDAIVFIKNMKFAIPLESAD